MTALERALLAEARAALGPEWCGSPNSLAGRIDDCLHPVANEPVHEGRDCRELVEPYLVSEFAWSIIREREDQ